MKADGLVAGVEVEGLPVAWRRTAALEVSEDVLPGVMGAISASAEENQVGVAEEHAHRCRGSKETEEQGRCGEKDKTTC